MTEIHFIQLYGSDERARSEEFSFINYISVKSAIIKNAGYSVNLFVDYLPSGLYWELLKEKVTVILVKSSNHMCNGLVIEKLAHKADVLRLQILIERGGIYLDTDIICQRPFSNLLSDKVVMGKEELSTGEVVGLCNAVIISPPQAEFLLLWLAEYHDFDGTVWNEHSIRRPYKLSHDHPNLVEVLPREYFFWPSWEAGEVIKLFESKENFGAAYAFHLWSAVTRHITAAYDENTIANLTGPFGVLAREVVKDDLPTISRIRHEKKRMFELSGDVEISEKFTSIYANSLWGPGSGVGSLYENNIDYIKFLSEFLVRNNVRSVIDFGCGDWQFSQFINWDKVDYCGIDVVLPLIESNIKRFGKENVRFEVLKDLDQMKTVDLIICKEVFQHLPNEKISEYIMKFKKLAKFIIVINDEFPLRHLNGDIESGQWRSVRMDFPPFCQRCAIVFSWLVHYETHITRKSAVLIYGDLEQD